MIALGGKQKRTWSVGGREGEEGEEEGEEENGSLCSVFIIEDGW